MTIARITDLQDRPAGLGRPAGRQCAMHSGNHLSTRRDRIMQAHPLQDRQAGRLQHETRADRLRRCHLVINHDPCATPGQHRGKRQPANTGAGDGDVQPFKLHGKILISANPRSIQLPFDRFGRLPKVLHTFQCCRLKRLA